MFLVSSALQSLLSALNCFSQIMYGSTLYTFNKIKSKTTLLFLNVYFSTKYTNLLHEVSYWLERSSRKDYQDRIQTRASLILHSTHSNMFQSSWILSGRMTTTVFFLAYLPDISPVRLEYWLSFDVENGAGPKALLRLQAPFKSHPPTTS